MFARGFILALVLGGAGGIVSADLVGYWPLDGNALDASGYGNHGTILGKVVPTADRFGNGGGAMSFAGGSSDRIDLGDRPEFQITGAVTIAAWAYLDSTSPVHGMRNSRILSKMGGGGSRGWSGNVEKSVNGVLLPASLQVASGASTVVSLNDDAMLPLDQWVHYAGVYRPGVSMEVYLNGDLAAIKTEGIPASQYSANSVSVYIGNRSGATDCGWYGALDEVRLYNEALSQAEIQTIMGGQRINRKPDVDAGQGVVLVWPENTCVLDATVVDDGLGDPDGYLDYVWSMVEGPGAVTFEPSPFVEDPTVSFSAIGEYTLLLTATDGELDGGDTVTIRVVEPFCPLGDLNGDCRVNLDDLLILSDAWLVGGPTADIDRTGRVDLADFSLAADEWRVEKTRLPLVINEILARNVATEPPDPQGQYEDWLEIYNYGDEPVDIGGMYLTDDLNRPAMWRIPADQPEATTIAGRGYLIIWADGDVSDSGLHAVFSLSADEGEEVGLFDVDGRTLIDSVAFGGQAADVSYGREPDAGKTWRTLAPSPGASNNGRFLGVVADVKCAPEHGFFDAPFEVTLTTETAGATIWFTTDCSHPVGANGTPTATAQAYHAVSKPNITTTTCLRAAAIAGPGWKPSPVVTHTYIFLDSVLTQTRPGGYPTSWNYGMDPAVVSHSAYAGRIRDDLQSLPAISIVASRDTIFGSGGVIGAAANSVEIEASAEMIHPDGRKGFQINCGLIPHSHVKEKRGLRLYFRSEYGLSRLRYPIFGDAPEHAESAADEFDRLILRAGGNDQLRANAAGRQVDRAPQGVKASYLTDQLARDSQIAMSGYGSHGTFVHLYLNGLYWGLYNVVERPDAFFTSTYFGGKKEDWFAVSHSGDISGDDSRFDYLHTNRANWSVVREYLDVGQFCDYIIYYLYSGAGDWPNNNWFAGNRNVPVGGKIQYYIWDAEDSWLHAWKNDGHSYHRSNEGAWIHPVLLGQGGLTNGTDLVSKLWREVDNQSDFLMQFADRVYRHCFNDGALTDAKTIERWDNLCAAIEGGVVAESARWGRYRASPGLYAYGPLPNVWTREDWLWYTDYIRGLMDGNADRLIAALRDTTRAGPVLVNHPLYYPTIDPPEFLVDGAPVRGGHIADDSVLILRNPNNAGTIYYTENGADPRLSGGPINTTDAIVFSGSIPLHRTIHIKARVFNGSEWSPLNEAIFAVGPVRENLRITELMYHPPQEEAEYIELRNIGGRIINLAYVSFTNGVCFTFPALELAPGAYTLVVRNRSVFESIYGTDLNVAGEYAGALDNSGERIRLADAARATIHDFRYNDGWYEITSGRGFSLTIKDETNPNPTAWDQKSGWRPSAEIGGSPGRDDSGMIPPLGSIVINELLANSTTGDDWIELHNTTDGIIHVGGWFLSDGGKNLTKYEIPSGTTIDPGGYVVFHQYADFAFGLSENGETVYLTSGRDGVLTGYTAQESFGPSEEDVSFGRYQKSTGTFNFVAMSSPTAGAPNAFPKVGPVVISEIMYNPGADADAEYVELLNISDDSVALYDFAINAPWKFEDDGGIELFILDAEGRPVVMAAGERILLVRNRAAFAAVFTAPAGVQIAEWTSGSLGNAGEKIELLKPGRVDAFGVCQYIRVDRVVYSDGSHPVGEDPWPSSADGAGHALHRKKPAEYGNDVINWQASNPTPGVQDD
ncbi:MAG: lamin tail domain-containing protein [Phycisphaerae bacterium]|nr:lamin tail domain-containing protein [Phycisphaerae bacterium]